VLIHAISKNCDKPVYTIIEHDNLPECLSIGEQDDDEEESSEDLREKEEEEGVVLQVNTCSEHEMELIKFRALYQVSHAEGAIKEVGGGG
jgi:hypothetical protein